MKSKNMNYMYYHEYFDGLTCNENTDEKDSDITVELPNVDVKNSAITEFSFSDQGALPEWKKIEGHQEIIGTTLYPGLLIGTGVAHNIKAKGAIYNGFSFDPVSGLPYIPGSSLKGMLRSCFPDKGVKNSEGRQDYISYIVKQKCEVREDVDIAKLRDNIFENNDIFLGAYPVIEKGNDNKKEDNGNQNDNTFLAMDIITPHTPDWYSDYKPMKKYKNPVPVTILKVRPQVKFVFAFVLHDMIGEDGQAVVKAEQKCTLFEWLIKDMGIGAKTDVGFGRFRISPQKNKNKKKKDKQKDQIEKKPKVKENTGNDLDTSVLFSKYGHHH